MSEITEQTRHPLFLDARGRDTGQVVAVVVERKDKPGALGVARRGARFVVALPEGYDMHTAIRYWNGHVIVAHPNLPPLEIDFVEGKVKLINDAMVEAQPARIKLAK